MMEHTNHTGGSRNRVPKPGSADMPEITSLKEFKDRMKFYSVIGHGVIGESGKGEEGSIFIVPPKTYIFFITRAGIPAEKVKTGAIKESLYELYYQADVDASVSNANVNTNGSRYEKVDSWWNRIYNSMNNGTLLQDVLYKPTSPNNDSTYAIYEPGDIVQNMLISFSNDVFPYMMLGIWKLPIRKELKKYLDKLNESFDNFPELVKDNINYIIREANNLPDKDKQIVLNKMVPFYQNLNKTTAKEEKSITENADILRILRTNPGINNEVESIYKTYKSMSTIGTKEDYFKSDVDNLMKQFPSIERTTKRTGMNSVYYMKDKNTTTLYNILHEQYNGEMLEGEPILATRTTDGKDLYRFIVVDACRSLNMPENNISEHRLRRSMSGYSRPEICKTSLLELTKKSFESLPNLSSLQEDSIIKELLKGKQISLTDFEKALASERYTFPELSKYHTFAVGETVFPYTKNKPLKKFPLLGYTVSGINIDSSKGLQYRVKDPFTQKESSFPAMQLWRKPSNISEQKGLEEEEELLKAFKTIQEVKQHQEAEEAEKKYLENLEKKAKEQNEAFKQKKAANAIVAAQKKQADIDTFNKEEIKNKIRELPESKQKIATYGAIVKIVMPPPPSLPTLPPRLSNSASANDKDKRNAEIAEIQKKIAKIENGTKLYNSFNGEYGFVRTISLNTAGTIVLFVDITRIGYDKERLPDQFWSINFVEGASKEEYDEWYAKKQGRKKGGRRKTRRSKKSKKQRKTRRH